MDSEWISELETPCIVIDLDKTMENLRVMQAAADMCGCRLRPHIKTHKMKRFAQLQLKCGAAGITCAKVSEAEVMADGGADDIFIAYPLVGAFRIRRALRLNRRVTRLILAIDSLEGAQALSQAAVEEGTVLEIRLEVDTGAKRTGTPREHAVELAKAAAALPGLKLTGIYTFKSLVYQDKPTTDKALAGREEGEMMWELAQDIRAAGVEITDISAGSSPTGIEVAKTGRVTEIRPGTYLFKDFMLCKEGVAEYGEIAAHFYATVVSVPCEEYAVIDGGTKTFPTDIVPNTPPFFYPGYAIVDEGDGDLILSRMNEEHGIITSKKGKTGLRVGQVIRLTPIHVCTAVNMQNQVYLYDGKGLEVQPVDARGMLV